MKLYYFSLTVLLGWVILAWLIDRDRWYLYLLGGLILLQILRWVLGSLRKKTDSQK